MLTFGALALAAPWFLTALAMLPIIWWLLRVTPPSPREVRFPAIRLLFDLVQREETPARTPWWLILLRLLLAALVILALARPLLNPAARLDGVGPLVIVVDDGWAGAPDWTRKLAAMGELLDHAERDRRPAALLTTAPTADGAPPALVGPMRASDLAARVQALRPQPWPSDRGAARDAVLRLRVEGSARAVWFTDGLDGPGRAALAETLQGLGSLRVVEPVAEALPVVVAPPENRPGDVEIALRRAPVEPAHTVHLRALAQDGRVLAREPVTFAAGGGEATHRLRLPTELRNQLTRLELDGQDQVGGVALLDDRFQRRTVGVVGAAALESAQSLLDDGFYIERALLPFAEIRRGTTAELVRARLSLLAVPDAAPLDDADRAQLHQFIEQGGTVLRFAGAKLAQGGDDLTPVRLRQGGRALGTAMQWSQPAQLAPFDRASPFLGLAIPEDVVVRRQVLAEPSVDLGERTLARLSDGTPLVTAERRGGGWLVLFHVPANPEWSSLPFSGLFVEMLRRIVGLARGGAVGEAQAALPAFETLDGFGRAGTPPAGTLPLAAGTTGVGPRQPPGYYGNDTARRALNLGSERMELVAIANWPAGVMREFLGRAGEIDLAPWLLAAALAVALIDLLVALALRGHLSSGRRRAATATLALALLAYGPAIAQSQTSQQATPPDTGGRIADPMQLALKATLETRLGYVLTGDGRQDEMSLAGLRGLTLMLNRRTAIEAAAPIAVDIETDELAFFPLIYWPVTSTQPPPSTAAAQRVNFFLRNGGTILFDTRDDIETVGVRGDDAARRLQRLVRGLDIPPLVPVPGEHVLTKAFYLLTEFPGRYVGQQLWVDAREGGVDEVSSVIVGGNDYAAAWAIDANGRSLFTVAPGGDRQRELAYRFGINLMMYALTGNYKADQVHVNAILERLGQ
jgi:hypothetical protein